MLGQIAAIAGIGVGAFEATSGTWLASLTVLVGPFRTGAFTLDKLEIGLALSTGVLINAGKASRCTFYTSLISQEVPSLTLTKPSKRLKPLPTLLTLTLARTFHTPYRTFQTIILL